MNLQRTSVFVYFHEREQNKTMKTTRAKRQSPYSPSKTTSFFREQAVVLHLKLNNVMNKTVVPPTITTIMKKYKDILVLLLSEKQILFFSLVTLRSSASPLD